MIGDQTENYKGVGEKWKSRRGGDYRGYISLKARKLLLYPWGGGGGNVLTRCYPFLDVDEAEHETLRVEKLQ